MDRAAAKGDGVPSRVAERFAEHRERIRRYLLGRVRDAHAADDLTQETLVRALRYGEGLRDPHCAVAWLLRIAWHVSLDFGRRRSRRRARFGGSFSGDAADRVQEPTPTELDEGRQAHAQWRRRLHAALARLGKLDRVLVVGHYFVGLTCAELATRSGLRRDTVKMRLCRARRRMRASLPDGWLEDWEATPGPMLRRIAPLARDDDGDLAAAG